MVSVIAIAARCRRLPWGVAAFAMLSLSGAAHAACTDIVPTTQRARGTPAPASRSVAPEDLVRLRDIGQPDAALIPPESPLATSPDGRRLAFVISRADPASNAYCRALAVMEVAPGARPRIVDIGGEHMMLAYPLRGLVVHPGYPELIVPAWSPDGRWIAYRKRVEGRTGVWIAAADGSGARAVGRLDDDVEALAWSADGARIVAVVRPGYRTQEQRIAAEGASGYLYDDRFRPEDAARPALTGPEPRELLSIDVASGQASAANAADARRLTPDLPLGVPAALLAASGDGRRAWLAPETEALSSPMRVHAEGRDGKPVACRAEACAGSIPGLLWVDGTLVFLRREGWAKGSTALYRWVPGEGAPRRILQTDDVVHGCVAARGALLCLAENAVTPRHIERVDSRTGARELLFDPNPEFAHIRLGEVHRLKFRNDRGLEAWGDLALPPGHAGGRLPLVVVQYHSDGFLRGGTGDDYPVHAFAARGIAVLSFERPVNVATADPNVRTAEQINAANERGWADKASLLSAIEIGVNQAVARGVADPKRIGITGLSDGATTTAYALIHSDMFAAAAISSCCLEPQTLTYGGPRWAAAMRKRGNLSAAHDASQFWKPVSLAQNAEAIDTPLLMQLADREYLIALETWTALSDAKQPVEMHVFPDEYHAKWQPAHRLAVYQRSLDWFDYWLAGRRDPDPAKHAQYQRWDTLRQQRDGPER